ncbi:hypothetical protein I3843_15G137900 [Carya illinoinensis]|nr:hypothetical protein I3843_15G137900 [Carya illinoinensis]
MNQSCRRNQRSERIVTITNFNDNRLFTSLRSSGGLQFFRIKILVFFKFCDRKVWITYGVGCLQVKLWFAWSWFINRHI